MSDAPENDDQPVVGSGGLYQGDPHPGFMGGGGVGAGPGMYAGSGGGDGTSEWIGFTPEQLAERDARIRREERERCAKLVKQLSVPKVSVRYKAGGRWLGSGWPDRVVAHGLMLAHSILAMGDDT